MVRRFIRENHRGFLRLIFGGRFAFSHNVNFQELNRYNNPILQEFSTIGAKPEKFSCKGSSQSILLGNLGRSLKEHQVVEAWETYKDFKRLYGFPDQFLVVNLITQLSYSSDSKCLRRAYDLVLSVSKEKSVLLSPDVMTKLVLSLARAQIPVLAANVLRLMLEKRSLPSVDVLRMVFLHLVKTETGTYLASNILDETCDCFLKLNVKNKSGQNELTKPDVMIFNLVLDACVRFGTSLKGQQIMELMTRVGVIADAHTVMIIARIHEMNGMRDELKKFKDHVDMVSATLIRHYQQFYDCLLSLHFKFNDLDGASALLLDLYRSLESTIQRDPREQQKSCTVSIGSENIKMGSRLQFLPKKLQRDSVYKTDSKNELLLYKNGKLVLSNKGMAKLIIGFKKSGRINKLSKLLITIQNMLILSENSSSCSDVIDACIYLGWLETAHDILEDLESEKYCIREGSYVSLLNAYHNKKMLRETEGLLRQIKRAGLAINLSDEKSFRSFEDRRALDLANSIIQNMREEDKEVPF
ncbi:hypothetical protein CDL12_16737 [Handroanthus impetiginosus]|uniref:At1g68980-like TPR repeats domain-containing protein n=1 Tax=Handroanthus impetiginosus TaxID=429701 RepID=A0A2G9GZH0_9LAMI|nr:hypothetical protein CDL12_16737 [Handroanthus impetiginosus]